MMNATPERLRAQILTQQSFSAFGDVIEVSEHSKHFTINDGFSERYHDLAKVDVNNGGGRPLINIFRSTPMNLPIIISKMERHPLSSQAFMPISGNPFLVVVAPAGQFEQSRVQAFLAASNQGVNYHAGAWHHFCLALNSVSDFLVIDRGNDAADDKNCDEVELEQPLQISFEHLLEQTTKQIVD